MLKELTSKVGGEWKTFLDAFFATTEGKHLAAFIEGLKDCVPAKENIFKAFELCKFEDFKVLVLGQDPYHTPGAAHGLSFSVPYDYPKTPPSLLNIRKEMAKDIHQMEEDIIGNDLSYLAVQGVLLLNSALTTKLGVAGAHKKEWLPFTRAVMTKLGKQKGKVFMLWGQDALQFQGLINHADNLVLTAAHPSPFSAYKGFFGCKHFSKANAYLEKQAILW